MSCKETSGAPSVTNFLNRIPLKMGHTPLQKQWRYNTLPFEISEWPPLQFFFYRIIQCQKPLILLQKNGGGNNIAQYISLDALHTELKMEKKVQYKELLDMCNSGNKIACIHGTFCGFQPTVLCQRIDVPNLSLYFSQETVGFFHRILDYDLATERR